MTCTLKCRGIVRLFSTGAFLEHCSRHVLIWSNESSASNVNSCKWYGN